MTGTVLEEGLRGAGGYLLNGARERFMQQHDARAERATRDIVSRAIFAEMRAGNTTPNGGVYLTMNHLGAEHVRAAFKGMVERCADCGFDLAGGMVEVVPTAHYMMGGVLFNGDCSTSLPGLFAAGEDTGGVHGANRLGGNGVANSTVFGAIAGDAMAAWVRAEGTRRAPDEDALQRAVADAEQPFHHAAGDIEQVREALLDCMWEDVGIVRSEAGLARAARRLAELDDQLNATGMASPDRAFNLTWHDWLNLSNLILVSRAIQSGGRAPRIARRALSRRLSGTWAARGVFVCHRAFEGWHGGSVRAGRTAGEVFDNPAGRVPAAAMIVISEFMDAAAVDRLRADFEVHHDATLVDDLQRLYAAAKSAEALIVRNRTQVDAALLANAPRLRVVGRLGVGLDNIDTAACAARAIEVILRPAPTRFRSPNMYYDRDAAAARRLHIIGRSRRRRLAAAKLSQGREVCGKTLGLVGFGSIGRVTAQRAHAIGMRVIAYDALLAEADAAWREHDVVRKGLDQVVAEADIVSLHVPLDSQTRGLINASRIALMKRGAIIINTSRGGIVDEVAVAAALRAGSLAGAALDVFEHEPLAANSALADVPNLILTPHIAGVTQESNVRVGALIAEHVAASLRRSRPR